MFLKFDPYRVWCSIFYSKLVNCILFKIIVQHVCFEKDRGTCGSGERNVKIWIDFRNLRFSLTSPLSQLREKSSHPVFTMCGEPWYITISVHLKSGLIRGVAFGGSLIRGIWYLSVEKQEWILRDILHLS
jgi:hypothetical protein